jgi:1-acyl-sn-glycerol-3-phosphate acyltransferase
VDDQPAQVANQALSQGSFQQREPQFATHAELTQAIGTEVLVAAGLPRTGPVQTLLRPLVWPPCHRFARLAAAFERRVAEGGLTAAVRWILPRFVTGIEVGGAHRIPTAGPLVVASNHPGSYDSLLLISCLARDDLKIFVSDVPILRGLYATSHHFIYTPADPHRRMEALREGARHLQAGGALLVFATGVVDPDPELRPGSTESLQNWSLSLPLFVRLVPATASLVAIVRGVVSPACYHHPLTRLRKEPQMRQFLAEFIQIGQQVLFGRRFGLRPTVRFGSPLTAADLDGGRNPQAALSVLTDQARMLLGQA